VRLDLGFSPETLQKTLAMLQAAGILTENAPAIPLVSDVRPSYAGSEVAQGVKRDSAFRHVVDETQRRLGKVLSSNDMQILFGLYDWRGMSPGVISLLVTYCLEDARRRYGEGRPPTMRQIDKEAAIWEERGIDTEEKAEQYIQETEDKRQMNNSVYRLLGISGRAPSATEERYIGEWINMGFQTDVISLAYDKTVLGCGKLSMKYMNSILKNWHEKNLHTRQAVESGDMRQAKKYPAGNTTGHVQNAPPGRSELEAVERMRRYIGTVEK
jgi:DnaD/phage-associated family protein